jgi:hypothetical protein
VGIPFHENDRVGAKPTKTKNKLNIFRVFIVLPFHKFGQMRGSRAASSRARVWTQEGKPRGFLKRRFQR